MKNCKRYRSIIVILLLFVVNTTIAQEVKKVVIYHTPFHISVRGGLTSENIKKRADYKIVDRKFNTDEYDLISEVIDSCNVFSEDVDYMEFVRAFIIIKLRGGRKLKFYCTKEQFLFDSKVYNASKEFRDMFPLLWHYE